MTIIYEADVKTRWKSRDICG